MSLLLLTLMLLIMTLSYTTVCSTKGVNLHQETHQMIDWKSMLGFGLIFVLIINVLDNHFCEILLQLFFTPLPFKKGKLEEEGKCICFALNFSFLKWSVPNEPL